MSAKMSSSAVDHRQRFTWIIGINSLAIGLAAWCVSEDWRLGALLAPVVAINGVKVNRWWVRRDRAANPPAAG